MFRGFLNFTSLFLLLGILFSPMALQAQECTEVKAGMPSSAEIEAEIAEVYKGDTCATLMFQADFFFDSGRQMQPSTDSKTAWVQIKQLKQIKATLCFWRKAEQTLAASVNNCGDRVPTFNKMGETLESPGDYLRLVRKLIRFEQARELLFDMVREGRYFRFMFSKKNDLNLYARQTEDLLARMKIFSNSEICSSQQGCQKATKNYRKGLIQALYKKGGELPGGPTQVQWKADKALQGPQKK